MHLGGLHQVAVPEDVSSSSDTVEELVLENEPDAYTYAPAANETMMAPHPFARPTKPEYRDPLNNQVAFIARSGPFSRHSRVTFYAKGIPGLYNKRAYFVAQRVGRGRYAIFNVYDDNSEEVLDRRFTTTDARYVGELKRVSKHGHVHYVLLRKSHGGSSLIPVATTIYNRASLYFPVVHGSPDRIAYSVIHNKSSHQGVTDKQSASTLSRLASEARDHEHIHSLVDEQYNGLTLFQSKRRFTDRRGRKTHRDVQTFQSKFGGRLLVPSKKNLQLMNVSSGKNFLQMGRLTQAGEFCVDFVPPFTPFLAFGFCLAQLDAN